MGEDGPPLLRPVPRRPFVASLTNPSSPDDEPSSPSSPNPNANIDFSSLFSSLAPPSRHSSTPDMTNSTGLTRPSSYINLTSSTLGGIFAPTASSSREKGLDPGDLVGDTPWDTGAQTPVKRPGLDDATYELMRARSHQHRRKSSLHVAPEQPTRLRVLAEAISWISRAALLFLLGCGYGVLVTRFHDGNVAAATPAGQVGPITKAIVTPSLDWRFQLFWGLSGVFLGAVLPWVDKAWDRLVHSQGQDRNEQDDAVVTDTEEDEPQQQSLSDHWVTVVRPVGAFVGIAFAIRKLAWTSTLQLTLTLALTNPLLWWLIDRSLSGFVLSAFIGICGSVFLLGVNPSVMAAPFAYPFSANDTTSLHESSIGRAMLGGLASQATVESGMWMVSVLFCSCLCFGNIGRRLVGPSMSKNQWRWST